MFGLLAVNGNAACPREKAVASAIAALKDQLTGTMFLSGGSRSLGETWSLPAPSIQEHPNRLTAAAFIKRVSTGSHVIIQAVMEGQLQEQAF